MTTTNKKKTFSHTQTHTTMRIPHEQPGMNYVRSRIPYRLAITPPYPPRWPGPDLRTVPFPFHSNCRRKWKSQYTVHPANVKLARHLRNVRQVALRIVWGGNLFEAWLLQLRSLFGFAGGLTFCFRRGIPKSLKANVPQHWKIFHSSVPLASVSVWFGFGFECTSSDSREFYLSSYQNL